MSVNAPAWLTARPIAHRGLHDRARGVVENSLAAAHAAIAGGYAIECDVQISRDGEAIVFHDETLERLTGAEGRADARDAAELTRLAYRDGPGAPPTLAAFLADIAGRVPVIVEIKSNFAGDMRLADRTAEIAAGNAGPVALKSFDPRVVARLRAAGCGLPLGIVAEASYDHPEWAELPSEARRELAALTHFPDTRPDFLSWCVGDLPHAAATLFRAGLARPVMTWTVRTPEQRARAALYADQMVFEGFAP